MKQSFVGKWLVAGVLAGLPGLSAPAQNGQTGALYPYESRTPESTNGVSVKPAVVQGKQKEPSEQSARTSTPSSAGIGEILRMVTAGVTKEVMMAYIETSAIAFHLTAADVISLKENAVPDDLTMAMMKRGAELTAQASQANASTATAARVRGAARSDAAVAAFPSGRLNPGSLDPESYDYFWYYYLYPRTLASANQRLLSSYPTFGSFPSYASSYYPPWTFRQHSFPAHFRAP